MRSSRKVLISEENRKLPRVSNKEFYEHIRLAQRTELENVLLKYSRVDHVSIFASYVEKFARTSESENSAILELFLAELRLDRDGNVVKSFYTHWSLLNMLAGTDWEPIGFGDPEKATELCKRNANMLFAAQCSRCDLRDYKNKLLIGVCLSAAQNMCAWDEWQLGYSIEKFVSGYFNRHPHEFPIGDWRELVLMSTL